MSQKKWKPTRNQVKFLSAFMTLAPTERPTNVLLAMKVGISQQALYKWFRKVEFMAWFDRQIEKHLNADLARVWASMRGQAIGGDCTAAKLFVERFDGDYKPTSKQELDIATIPRLHTGNGQRLNHAKNRLSELTSQN